MVSTCLLVIGSIIVGGLLAWGLPALFEYMYWRPKSEQKRIRRSMQRELSDLDAMTREAHEQIRNIGRTNPRQSDWF